MRGIICTEKECQALEALATAGLVKDKVIDVTLKDEETGALVNQTYNGLITHHDGRIAFRVVDKVEKYLPDIENVVELSWDWTCPANKIKGHKATQYWCAYSCDYSKVYRIGVVEVGQELTTGQPYLLYADTEAELEARVDAIMGEGYYQKRKEE